MTSSYTPTFAAPMIDVSKEGGSMLPERSLDFSAQLGFQAVDCAISGKADECAVRLDRERHHALHRELHCTRADVARLAPAAFAGAAATVGLNLMGCADQTAFLQNQQLGNDLANAQAAAGQAGLTVFQLAAFQSRSLDVAKINQAQKSGIQATTAQIAAVAALYGGYGYYGAPGYGYGAPGVGGGCGGGLAVSNVGAGCLR